MDHRFPKQGSTKYNTWSFCIRPRDGMSNQRLEIISEWIGKQAFGLVVTEMTGEARHAHCLVAFRTGRIRSNVINAVLNLKGMDFTAEEASAFRSRNYAGEANPKIWYSWAIVSEYLVKDIYYKIWHKHLPPREEWDQFANEWFPSLEDKRIERGSTTNAEWRRIRTLWVEYSQDAFGEQVIPQDEHNMILFFKKLQRQDKMRAIQDMKLMQQKVRWFLEVYLCEEDELTSNYLGSASKRLKTVTQEVDQQRQLLFDKNPLARMKVAHARLQSAHLTDQLSGESLALTHSGLLTDKVVDRPMIE